MGRMIYDFFKIRGDNEAILDIRDLPKKVQLKNDSFQAIDTKSDEVLPAVTDRPADNILESLYKMQIAMSEGVDNVLQVYAQETTLGDDGHKTSRAKKIKDSHFKARNRDDDMFATGAPSNGKAKGNGRNNYER